MGTGRRRVLPIDQQQVYRLIPSDAGAHGAKLLKYVVPKLGMKTADRPVDLQVTVVPIRVVAGQRRRWELNPLGAALQAAALPSGSSAQSSSVLARSRTGHRRAALVLRPSQGRVLIRHTPRTCFCRAPRRGIEPGHHAQRGRGSFEDCHAIRHTREANRESSPTEDRGDLVNVCVYDPSRPCCREQFYEYVLLSQNGYHFPHVPHQRC